MERRWLLIGLMALVVTVGCSSKPQPEVASAPLPGPTDEVLEPDTTLPPWEAPQSTPRGAFPDISRHWSDRSDYALDPDGWVAAILLPLSGTNAALGQRLLAAAQIAVFDLGKRDFILRPFDTGGTVEGAVQAVHQALDADADIILGPIYAGQVRAITPYAQRNNIPVLAFSSDREVASPGIFVLGAPVEADINRLVGEARRRGKNRLAVIAPRGDLGQRVLEEVRAASESVFVGSLNVRLPPAILVDSYLYDPFVPPQAWVETFARRAYIHRADPEKEGDQDIPAYDGLMVISGYDNLIPIVSLLSYYDVDGQSFQFLGNSTWQGRPLWLEPALRGAWFAGVVAPDLKEFEQRYRNLYGHAAPRLASLVWDGVVIASSGDWLAEGSQNPEESSFFSQYRFLSALRGINMDYTASRDVDIFRIGSAGAAILSSPVSIQ